MRSWTITVEGKLFTLNSERSMHYHKRAKLVKGWRESSCVIAKQMQMPPLEAISVIFQPYRKDRRAKADTGGHFPVAKACIDGLVDAGVLTDDGPEVVRTLTFNAPIVDGGQDRAVLVVNEVSG